MSLRQQKKLRARADILAAAGDLIVAQGLEATTTRAIADAAGISYQTLYNYFPSKASIVYALLTKDVAELAQQIDLIVKEYNGELLKSLGLINRARLQFISETDRSLWRSVAAGLGASDEAARDLVQMIDSARHERYYGLLSMAQGMGQLKSGIDLHLMAHTLHILAEYSVEVFIFQRDARLEAILKTLNEQTAQLVQPYLEVRIDASA